MHRAAGSSGRTLSTQKWFAGGKRVLDSLKGNTDLLWPILVYGAIVLSLVLAMLGLSFVLGQRHKERATEEPYEGGILSTGSARLRFSAQFYLIAMLFVIFDVETIFIVSWAIAFRELGWYGYAGVMIFVILLFVVLIYEWRNGALDFGPDGKKILKAYWKLNRKKPASENIVKRVNGTAHLSVGDPTNKPINQPLKS
jgi:NADH-quinone oxidoreductase subunit A